MPQQIRMRFSNLKPSKSIQTTNILQSRQNIMVYNSFQKIGYGNMNSIFYSKGSSCG